MQKTARRNAPLQIFKDLKDMGQERLYLSEDKFIILMMPTVLS